MFRELYTLSYNSLGQLAEQYFENMPGVTAEGLDIGKKFCQNKFVRVSSIIFDRADIKQNKCCINGDTLSATGIDFSCNGFERIEKQALLGAGFYLLTSEDIDSTGDLVEDFYIHMWQTAYLDAARDSIKNKLSSYWVQNKQDKKKVQITNSYGPGFYGMDVEELEKFFVLLDGSAIGVSLNGNMMSPVKTCTGVYLIVDESLCHKILPCVTCKYNNNCELCSVTR